MLSLDVIRKKIKSIENTAKITNAMYLVATANLQKCWKQFGNSKVFFGEFYKIVAGLIEWDSGQIFDIFQKNGPTYYIYIGSEIGLCGAYNINLFNLLRKNLKRNDKVCLIGNKSYYLFKTNNLAHVLDQVIELPSSNPDLYFAKYVANLVLKQIKNSYAKIVIVYTKYRNALILEPLMSQALPIDPTLFHISNSQNNLIEYEPSKSEILKHIVNLFLAVFIHGAVSESLLSENCARRNSMKTANKNAEKLIKEYRLIYNKVRQSNITQEIIEVVTGSDLDYQ